MITGWWPLDDFVMADGQTMSLFLERTSMDAWQAVPASTTEPADMLLHFAAQEINKQSSHKYLMIICGN